ncbi:MAG: rubrerythrin family protein [Candidatus Aureabacteria bacterium]|nr:rubrerythrin family protein [Candidatus Auribacterota bacterium]
MHEMTATHLRSAYGGESMAHMRYGMWGAKAAEEGFPNVARLFKAIAVAEEVHAWNHFRELRDDAGAFAVNSMAGFGLGSTPDNLQGAIEGELFEINEMYPVYKNAAQFQAEKGAERSFHYALSAERIHAAMYQEAKQAVDGGRDVELGPVQICSVCGFTGEGASPARCPVCGAAKEKFRTFA